jgi:hypothetical protein
MAGRLADVVIDVKNKALQVGPKDGRRANVSNHIAISMRERSRVYLQS